MNYSFNNLKCWLVLYTACVVLFSLHAAGHTRLLATEPRAGQAIDQPPTHLTLRFSTPVETKFTVIEIAKAGEDTWQTLRSNGSARDVTAELPALSPATYKVRWRVLSRDGHMQRGQFKFTVR